MQRRAPTRPAARKHLSLSASAKSQPRRRCTWAKSEPSISYHDHEWGVPLHDDRALFEFLILEGAQAGLSWETILRKREDYRASFDRFNPRVIARYDQDKIDELLSNPRIIRNRLKISAAIHNARAFLDVQKAFGSFNAYLWQFVGSRPKQNRWRSCRDVPCRTPEADALSKDLIRRGFKFVGPTICYAFMQAVGMVNDHSADCFRHKEVRALGRR
jgi:DNA-3-methyladenine glycosylase I